MASVLNYGAGKSFIFEVRKWLTNNPARKWRNRYEVLSIDAGTLADLVILGHKLVDYERYFHPTSTWFVEWIVSTGAHDSDPYNPETFYSEAINMPGQWSRGGHSPVDLDIALFTTRRAYTGRQGRLFYRDVLGEEDIVASGGKGALETASLVPARLQTAITTVGLDAYFANGPNTVLRLVLIGNNGEHPRVLLGLTASGVSICKTDHRYFDRRNTPSSPPVYAEGDLDETTTGIYALEDPAYDPDPIE